MKYNILGFYQPRAIELGLDSNDLLVLRWFIDYAGTNKMRTIIENNKMYYWVNYKTVLEELPILKVSKQTLVKKHFGNLVKASVLEHKFIKEGGSFSYYCYGINYDTLIYLQTEGGCVKNNEGTSNFTKGALKFTKGTLKFTKGYVNSDVGGTLKFTNQINNNNIKSFSNINNNKNNNIIEKENIKEKDILDYWNACNIIEHRELTEAMCKTIKKAIKEYGVDQIKTCINRYATMIHDTDYFDNYKWSLVNFLNRQKGITEFLDSGEKWVNYANWKSKQQSTGGAAIDRLYEKYKNEELKGN